MSPRLKIALAAAAATAVAALAFVGWQRLQPSSGLPSQVDVGTAAPFALADCKPRLFDGAPAIAVMFTQPLARSQDWGQLVKAYEGDAPPRAEPGEPAASAPKADLRKATQPVQARWVLGDNPRVLYLPYVTPDKLYRVEMAGALKSTAGATLATAQTCGATSEAMPAAFYFASRGVVLPAGLNGGLPVVTVNTPEVDVQFLRIEDAQLPAFLEQVAGRRERNTGRDGEEGDTEEGGYYDGDNRRLKGTVSGWQLDQQL